jgi:hypothetical protein
MAPRLILMFKEVHYAAELLVLDTPRIGPRPPRTADFRPLTRLISTHPLALPKTRNSTHVTALDIKR